MEATESKQSEAASRAWPASAQGMGSPPPNPGEVGLHALFEAQAIRTPDAPALIFGKEILSYARLNAWADDLAAEMRARGVEPDGLVGLAMERGPRLMVAVLATLKAGAACVPLALDYPAERLRRMIEDARPDLVLTTPFARASCEEAGVPCVLWDELPTGGNRRLRPVGPGWPGRRAYVLFTSGSTGRPKGVAMPHRALVNLVNWQCADSACGVGDRTLQFAALSFDVSFQEIFATLASGGTLVLIDEATRRDLVALAGVIRAERVARLYLPFAVLDDLSRLLLREDPGTLALREVIVAGEQLRITPSVRELFTRRPEARLVNHYGPTETHVATTFTLTGAAAKWPALPPIGRPVPHTVVHVLNAQLQPVPVGEPGELFIGGVQLADGYLHRLELTAERFVTNPFGDEWGGRLYRTGDGGRWRADGELEFLGRLDDQVKIRGHRVELGEIESVLSEAPGVERAAVVAWEDAAGEKRLGACVVARAGGACDPAGVLAWLRARLPEPMVPAGVAWLEAIPLNPNGKIDRRQLGGIRFAPWQGTRTLVRPETALEQSIERIWSKLLGRPEVGIDEDFFALGGHSLLALRAAARVGEVLGRDVPLRLMFEARTVRILARRLSEPGGAARPAIGSGAREGPLPLSFEQEQLWFIQQLSPAWCAYNVPLAIRWQGRWPGDAVRRALAVLERRHDMLRATFPAVEGRPFLCLMLAGGLRIEEEDLRSVPEAERMARLHERLREEATRPFDLAATPPVRIRVFKLEEADHVLFFNLHHILCDEWSLRLLLNELEALVAVGGDEARAGLAPSPVTYADYAVWQRQEAQSVAAESDRAFWRQMLTNAPVGRGLRGDHSRPRLRPGSGRTYEASLSAKLVQAVEAVGRRTGASAFVTWLALFRVLLARSAEETDLVIGTPFTLRQRAELHGVLGYLLNLLPLRLRANPEHTFEAAVRQEHAGALAAFEHGGLSFAEMARMGPGRTGEPGTTLISTMFVFVEQGVVPARWMNGQAGEIRVDTGTAKFALMLSMERRADGTMNCAWEYSTETYELATIERVHLQWEMLARQVAERPGVPLKQLDWPAAGAVRGAAAVDEMPATAMPVVAPATQPGLADGVEGTLARLWRELLGVEHVGPADDFFALGGHSLLAVRLMDAILREFGVLVPLSVMLASPGLRAQAREIESRCQPASARRDGEIGPAETPRAPFFLVGWMIQPEGFFQSADALYVLPMPELGETAADWRIDRLADACLETLRAVRPHGPYLLGGYSAAGIVAYAMACRLRAEGEEVAMLALIDSIPMPPWLGRGVRGIGRVGAALGMSDRRQLFWGRLAIWLGDDLSFAGRSGRAPFRKVWRKVRDRVRALGGRPGTADGAGAAPKSEGRYWRHLWAMAHFEPMSYDGELTLLISEETRRGVGRPAGGWSRWVRRVKEVPLPGNHMTCVQEHRAELAARLQALYDGVPRAAATGTHARPRS